MALWVKQSSAVGCCGETGWPKEKIGVGKWVNAITLDGWFDLHRRAQKALDLGIGSLLTQLIFQKSSHVGLWILGSPAEVGRYTKKPYTLEKIGLAVGYEIWRS